jgi:hypothetical protein
VRLAGVEACYEVGEVLVGEGPVKRLGDLVVMALERVEAIDDRLEPVEVVGREDLALDDREHDLDLVQPRRVGRQVHEDQVRPLALEAVDRGLAGVRGAVVDDPEDALALA